MMRFVRPLLALAALTAALPAAADDDRRHVMTPSQKIDMVRDLPDIGAFEKDGMYFDLGYIYPIHTVNGASVAGGSGESGFVLYHDDRYVTADGSIMSELGDLLGEDPTQGYTPPVARSGSSSARSSTPTAAADPWGANGTAADTDTAKGEPIASPPARASRRGSGVGLIGALFFLFIILFARVRLFRDLVVAGVLAAIAAVVRRNSEPDFVPRGPGVPDNASGAQATAQLARLDARAAAPMTPAAGGFGRKGV